MTPLKAQIITRKRRGNSCFEGCEIQCQLTEIDLKRRDYLCLEHPYSRIIAAGDRSLTGGTMSRYLNPRSDLVFKKIFGQIARITGLNPSDIEHLN